MFELIINKIKYQEKLNKTKEVDDLILNKIIKILNPLITSKLKKSK